MFIQNNVKALPTYVYSSSILPTDIAKALDNLHQKLFWRQLKDKNAIPLIAWVKIIKENTLQK